MTEKTLRIIQVGVAPTGIGAAWLSLLRESTDWELAGVVDVAPENRALAVERAGLAANQSFDSVEAAARAIAFDAAAIIVPSPAHARVCTEALRARKHLIVEKPFALDFEEARAVVMLAEQHDLRVMVDQNYRYMADILALRQAVHDQVAGRATFVSLSFNYDWPARSYQAAMADTMLLEMAIHHFDSLRFVLGTDPLTAHGQTWRPPWTTYAGDTWVACGFTFPGGIHALYNGSLEAPGAQDPWQGVWRIECERCALHLGNFGHGYGLYSSRAREGFALLEAFDGPPDPGSAIAGTLREFAAALRESRAPQSDGRDNLRTLAMAFGVGRSSRQGRVIDLQADYFGGDQGRYVRPVRSFQSR
jgi:predicted dehydrogenase